jgi:hypothetical protein
MKILILLSLLFSGNVYSKCWITGSFKGFEAKKHEAMKFLPAEMSKNKFVININGTDGSIVGSNMETFIVTGDTSLVGISIMENGTTTESWQIDESNSLVYLTKSTLGFGPFDGVMSLIGKVEGDCTSGVEKVLQGN